MSKPFDIGEVLRRGGTMRNLGSRPDPLAATSLSRSTYGARHRRKWRRFAESSASSSVAPYVLQFKAPLKRDLPAKAPAPQWTLVRAIEEVYRALKARPDVP